MPQVIGKRGLWVLGIALTNFAPWLSESLPVTVSSGRSFASAFANSSVTSVTITEDIVLLDSDWGSSPVLLDRNLTIVGKGPPWPVLEFNYVKGKVQLLGGSRLRFSDVVLTGIRAKNLGVSPGMDLLVPTPSGQQALLEVTNSMVIARFCYPKTLRADNYAGFVRAPGYNGPNALVSDLSQAGCVNDTSAPAELRCWASRGVYLDVAVQGLDLDEGDRQVRTNYVVRLLNLSFGCSQVVSQDCVTRYGPAGCVSYMIASLRTSPPSSPPAATSVEPPAAAGSAGQLPPSSSPRSSGRGLAAPLAGALGGAGAVLLALLAAGSLLRRRRRRRLGGGQGCKGEPSGAGDACVGVSLSDEDRQSPQPAPPGSSGTSEEVGLASQDSADLAQVHVEMEAKQQLGGEDPAPRPDSVPKLGDASVVVSERTPQRPDVSLGVTCGNEVQLTGGCLGQGTYGRVMEGTFNGQRVAVKLIRTGAHWLPAAALGGEDTGGGSGDGGGGGDSGASGGGGGGASGGGGGGGASGGGGGGDVSALSDEFLLSFQSEVEVLGRCCHPNVVRLLAACVGPPQPCLVMELCETSLERLLYGGRPGGPLPLGAVLHIGAEVARGLAYLHPTVLHRDLKPANVLLNDAAGERPGVKLTDFGLARLRHSALLTENPEAGTPAYTAPECFDPSNYTVTHKADMYSFGVLLAEMLAGQVPWKGLRLVEIAVRVTLHSQRPALLDDLPPSRCPPRLGRLVRSCWETDPQRRPAAADAVKTLLLVQQELQQGQ